MIFLYFFIFLKDLFYKLSLGCNTSHYLVIFLWKLINNSYTSSVSPELLQGFARSLALVANWRNITLLSINMKVNWRASFLKICEQANQYNNSGETEEVFFCVHLLFFKVSVKSCSIIWFWLASVIMDCWHSCQDLESLKVFVTWDLLPIMPRFIIVSNSQILEQD